MLNIKNGQGFATRVTGLGAAVIVLAIMTISACAMNGHAVSSGSLSLISQSSTQTDVKVLLGEPVHVSSFGENVVWQYTSFTWCIVTVVFGPDGNVRSVEHDH